MTNRTTTHTKIDIPFRINPDIVLDAVVGSSTGKSAFEDGMQQGVENSKDEQATRVDIRMDKANNLLLLLDNGEGLLTESLTAIIGIGGSKKGDKKDKIGHKGTGRLRHLQYCNGFEIYSVSKDYPTGIFVTTTRDTLREGIRNGYSPGGLPGGEAPTWWHLPAGKTGAGFRFLDINWNRVPEPEEFIAEFAHCLSKTMAKMVYVNGKPLKKREVLVEFQKEFDIEGLGVCRVDLCVPKERNKKTDALRIGGINPVCKLEQVYRHIRNRDLRRLIPEMLVDEAVIGEIYFPLLNDKKYMHQSRESFNQALYDPEGPIEKIVTFLAQDLRPYLEQVFGNKQHKETLQKQADTNKDYCARLRKAIGAVLPTEPLEGHEGPLKPGGPGTNGTGGNAGNRRNSRSSGYVPTLDVSRRRFPIMLGDTRDLTIRNADGEDYIWDDSQSGGTVEPKEGSKIVYTAGMKPSKEGTAYLLTVKKKSDPTKHARVLITIDSDLSFSVTPKSAYLHQGDEEKFTVVNYATALGKLEWKLSTKLGLKLSNTSGTRTTVIVAQNCLPGDYMLTLNAADAPDYVVKVPISVSRRETLNVENMLQIEDEWYEALPADTLQTEFVILRPSTKLDTREGPGQRVGRIRTKYDHPNHTGSMGFLSWACSVIVAHLDAMKVPAGEFKGRFDRIYSTILAGIK